MRDEMDDPLVHAFVARAERELGEITQAQLDDGWQRLRQARSAGAPARPVREARRLRLVPWLAGFAAAGLVLLCGTLAYRRWSAQPLHYAMEGSAARQGDAIEASPLTGSRLLFSDESRIVLEASTRVTVEGLDARGAHIGLLDGAIEVSVKPRASGSWRFAAGPFLVQVTGTSFRLGYAASLGRLQLQMASGSVEVSGPGGRTVTVGAGESLELFATPPPSPGPPPLAAATPDGEDTAPAPGARSAPSRSRTVTDTARRRVASLPAGEPASAPAGASVRPPAPPTLAWAQWLRQGKFAQVVADAEERGIEQVVAQARPADMGALADAARYIKRYPLSRRVLLAMRSRFVGTESANDASFFLGRLAEATSGSEAALDWYDTYLREAPRGLYAKEAMGREMQLRATSAPARAREVARQYLEHFPRGPEVELARTLVGSGTE